MLIAFYSVQNSLHNNELSGSNVKTVEHSMPHTGKTRPSSSSLFINCCMVSIGNIVFFSYKFRESCFFSL